MSITRLVELAALGPRSGDPAASARADVRAANGNALEQAEYVMWSGTTATTHKRVVLGMTGYGLGGELT